MEQSETPLCFEINIAIHVEAQSALAARENARLFGSKLSEYLRSYRSTHPDFKIGPYGFYFTLTQIPVQNELDRQNLIEYERRIFEARESQRLLRTIAANLVDSKFNHIPVWFPSRTRGLIDYELNELIQLIMSCDTLEEIETWVLRSNGEHKIPGEVLQAKVSKQIGEHTD